MIISPQVFLNANNVPQAELHDIRTFRNAVGTRADLILNDSETGHHLLREPKIEEIEQIVKIAEDDVLEDFLTELLMRRGTTVAGLKPKNVNEPHFRRLPLLTILRGEDAVFANHRNRKLHASEETYLKAFSMLPVAEQQGRLRACLPDQIRNLEPLVTGASKTLNAKLIRCLPSELNLGDPYEWLGKLQGLLGAAANSSFGFSMPLLLAIRLREARIVLWSRSTSKCFRYAESRLPASRMLNEYRKNVDERWSKLTDDSGLNGGKRIQLQSNLAALYFQCSVDVEDEVSWDLVNALGRNRGSLRFRRGLENLAKKADPNGHLFIENEDPWLRLVRAALGDDLVFAEWMTVLKGYRSEIVNLKQLASKAGNLRYFLGWLKLRAKEGTMPKPTELRREHIRSELVDNAPGRISFWSYLTCLKSKTSANDVTAYTKNNSLIEVNLLLLFLERSNPGFRNPLLDSDRFPQAIRSKAGHKRIPAPLLASIRDFIITRDSKTNAPTGWSENVQTLMYSQVEIHDAEGKIRTVFCPIMPAILWLMAEWPLRSSQVLWLDSGELDECRYDARTRKFHPNTIGISKRRCGVIAPAQDEMEVADAFGWDHHVDFQVIRNKRLKSERSDYTIPYMDGDTLWVIQQVLEWQMKFGASPVLVKQSQREGAKIDSSEDDIEIVSLFRLPQNEGKFPPAYEQFHRFWRSFCDSYDRAFASKPNWYSLVSKRVQRFYGRFGRAGKRSLEYVDPVYDLHCLRVGGISDMLSRGMPLALVAAIAGHRSFAMTFYYYKEERGTIRLRMSELLKSRPDLLEAHRRVSKLIQVADPKAISDLVGNVDILCKHIMEKVGVRVDHRGICPGTDCSEGLKLFRNDHGAIGGFIFDGLCPLCQFWITGFAFLPGIVKWFNELVELLVKANRRQQQLYAEMLVFDRDGCDEKALDCRNEADRIDQVSIARGQAAERLYELILQLLKDAERRNRNGEAGEHALVLVGGSQVRPKLEQLGCYEKLRELNLMDHLLPYQTSELAEEVTYELALRQANALGEYGGTLIVGLPIQLQKTANLALGELMERTIPVRSIDEVFESKKRFSDVLSGNGAETLRSGIANIVSNLSLATPDELKQLKANPELALKIHSSGDRLLS
jgi:integrase-like protein